MEDQRPPDGAQNYNGVLASQDDPVSTVQPNAVDRTEAIPSDTAPPLEYVVVNQKPSLWKRLRWVGLIVAILLLVGGGLYTIISRDSRGSQLQAGDFGVVKIPLSDLAAATSSSNAETLRVNGRLQVTDSIVLSPISQPSSALPGQLYFDQTSNELAYYNGKQFVYLNGNAAPSNITNILGGTGSIASAPSVQLQAGSPGVQQTGNFNVSGTGQVGTLRTTVIDSNGSTLYVNPLASSATNTQSSGGQAATLGLTAIGATNTGTGINSTIVGTKVTVGDVGGTANSITVYVAGGTAGKHIQVALYDDDGDVPSRPAGLLSVSAVANLTPNAFNTIPIPSIALTANASYWMAFNTDDGTAERVFNGGSKTSCFYGLAFGFMPDPFGSGPCFFANELYTMYVNYTTASSSGGSFSKALFSLSGTGQATFQNSEDSATAFQIQNAAGTTTIFNVDTLNGRIAIGKATAAYKLDIAAGDINLSNNRSIRFNGSQALTVSATGTATSISNFTPGGTVVAQADSFVVQDANAFHQNLVIDNTGEATFSNRVNSTTAFQIQNASGVNLMRFDTANLQIYIGNPVGDSTPVILYLANKNTSGDPVGAAGGIYYNSTLNTFRCYYSGFWQNCADIEPQHTFSLYDEFIGGGSSFTGQIGSLGWGAIAIGANGNLALNPTTPAPSANRPGVLQLTTPAVANQGTTLLLGDGSGGSMIIAKDNDMKTAVAPGSATGEVIRVGLHGETSTTTQPLSGVWWEANSAASANWRYCYGDATTATCADSGIALGANTWATLEVRVTATGSGTSAAVFVINGTPFTVSGVTIDTSNRVSPALSCYNTSGSAQTCNWDYFQLTGTTSTAR